MGLVAIPPLESREEDCDPVTEGELATKGNKAERATRTAALASRNCASACNTFRSDSPVGEPRGGLRSGDGGRACDEREQGGARHAHGGFGFAKLRLSLQYVPI